MQPTEPAPVALGYQRVQAPARADDLELLRRAAAIQDFCRHKGWRLLSLQRDVEVHPGSGPRQPALIHAVERIREGDASCLVVAELSDLCPSVAELGDILAALRRAGARLVSLDPPFDTGTLVGDRVVRTLSAVSGWERTRRANRTAAARSRAADPQIAPALRRRIVRMRDAGMTLQAIADRLNSEGVPTVRGGALWRPSSVQASLGYKRPRPWRDEG
jgi:DNA invertase Pin-like site-specific DNA recombinase